MDPEFNTCVKLWILIYKSVIGGYFQRGVPFPLCLYPPLTQTIKYIMNRKNNKPSQVSSSSRGLTPPSVDSSSDGRFNPYDYIDYYEYGIGPKDQGKYEEDLASLQYLAELAQQDYQNQYNREQLLDERAYNERITSEEREYNSPANQARLMKEAGLNPDLQNINFSESSGTPSPHSQPGSPAVMSNRDIVGAGSKGLQNTLGIVSTVASIAQVAMSMTSGINSLTHLGMSNLATDSQFLKQISESPIFSRDFDPNIETMINSMPISRSRRNRLKQFYESYKGSNKGSREGIYKTIDLDKAGTDWLTHTNSPSYLPFFASVEEEDKWLDVWKPIIDAQHQIMLDSLNFQKNQMKHSNSVYDLEMLRNRQDKLMMSHMYSTVQRMYKEYQNGSDFYGWALSALFAELQRYNFSPSNMLGMGYNAYQNSPFSSKGRAGVAGALLRGKF